MSKLAVIGPKDLLIDALTAIQELGIFHIDKNMKYAFNDHPDPFLKTHTFDPQTISQRYFFEDLKDKINTLLSLLPPIKGRDSFLSPESALDFLADVVPKHVSFCQEQKNRKQLLEADLQGLNSHRKNIEAIARLLPKADIGHDLDYLAVTLKSEKHLETLKKLFAEKIGHRFEIAATPAENGEILVLITTAKELSEEIHALLHHNNISEQELPALLADLPFHEQIRKTPFIMSEKEAELASIDQKLDKFAYSWRGVYEDLQKWLVNRLSLLQATASLFETEMCFIIFGWLPAKDVPKLSKKLREQCGEKIIIEEKEIREQDLERVPTIIKNPPYFQPFELFARLLPVPAYGSFDATPFIAVFFPIFFGMMLGDIGYGLILCVLSIFLKKSFKHKRNLSDAAKIVFICSIYTIIFGCLFGDFFGTVGADLLGLKPIFFHRHESLLPMLYFALAVGVVHIVIGLLLGILSAIRKKLKKEALFKAFSVLLIILVAVAATSLFLESFIVPPTPLVIIIVVMMPILFITGGLLAPLEVLKHIGNIISYARIMAIGLTSVLLAYVANRLAGMIGSIWLGIFVAITLHAFNIVLGVFAPTIHSLRLHYVEFLSKFMESGGTEYKPLEKK